MVIADDLVNITSWVEVSSDNLVNACFGGNNSCILMKAEPGIVRRTDAIFYYNLSNYCNNFNKVLQIEEVKGICSSCLNDSKASINEVSRSCSNLNTQFNDIKNSDKNGFGTFIAILFAFSIPIFYYNVKYHFGKKKGIYGDAYEDNTGYVPGRRRR